MTMRSMRKDSKTKPTPFALPAEGDSRFQSSVTSGNRADTSVSNDTLTTSYDYGSSYQLPSFASSARSPFLLPSNLSSYDTPKKKSSYLSDNGGAEDMRLLMSQLEAASILKFSYQLGNRPSVHVGGAKKLKSRDHIWSSGTIYLHNPVIQKLGEFPGTLMGDQLGEPEMRYPKAGGQTTPVTNLKEFQPKFGEVSMHRTNSANFTFKESIKKTITTI
ncbi:unnamed protein product [Haemonchus placei]|uniref:Uncharacterized protein n=1 Tax=Haemonchus placei TaxID=6290 RepID=A0A3P7YGZ8_HAEPC|nr:unnamed protein product [Haemonchus placei]